MKITRPLLAATITPDNIDKLRYPLLATPKLDGIRCLIINGKAVSRTFKAIPNKHIRQSLEAWFKGTGLTSLDGELTVGKCMPNIETIDIEEGTLTVDTNFQKTASGVMSFAGKPDFTYHVFDCELDSGKLYSERADLLLSLNIVVGIVYPVTIHNRQRLDTYETSSIEQGYEGIMLRAPDSPYKCGRSTFKEHYLLKLKRFHDAEAIVIGYEELMSNQNYSGRDNFGLSERSSSKDGLVPAGTLGALVVRDIASGVEFKIGTGFTERQRSNIWCNRTSYIGKVLTYKSQLYGVKVKPRAPVFKGWRLDL